MGDPAQDKSDFSQNPIHASCVSVDGNGLLIIGPSGAGKSSLALEMMAYGAQLVSDDRCQLAAYEGRLYASPPDTIAGRIEARGVGILNADHLAEVRVCAVLDLGKNETDRLPESRTVQIMGVPLPCYQKSDQSPLAAAMMQLLKAGRNA